MLRETKYTRTEVAAAVANLEEEQCYGFPEILEYLDDHHIEPKLGNLIPVQIWVAFYWIFDSRKMKWLRKKIR